MTHPRVYAHSFTVSTLNLSSRVQSIQSRNVGTRITCVLAPWLYAIPVPILNPASHSADIRRGRSGEYHGAGRERKRRE